MKPSPKKNRVYGVVMLLLKLFHEMGTGVGSFALLSFVVIQSNESGLTNDH